MFWNFLKLVPKTRPPNPNRSTRSPDAAKVQNGKSFAQALSGNSFSALNDHEKDHSYNKHSSNEGFKPSSAFERAIMERLDSIDAKFDRIARRLDNLEERINGFELDQYNEDWSPNNEWTEPEVRDPGPPPEFSEYKDITSATPSPTAMETLHSSPMGNAFTPPKRTSTEAALTSAEESYAHKCVKAENVRLRDLLDNQQKDINLYKQVVTKKISDLRNDLRNASSPSSVHGTAGPSTGLN